MESDLELKDGRTLHVYDARTDDTDARLTVIWHHGTPNTGAPPEPLFAAADRYGVQWVSYDRPGYGGSTPRAGRDIASAAEDVASIADALGIDRFAVMGHSGGAPHALACAALLPGRVLAAVCASGPAPFGAEGLDWFGGMAGASAAELGAAAAGRRALEDHIATAEFDPEVFTRADQAALAGAWSWLARVAGQAIEAGPEGMVDDNLAYVGPWGFDPGRVSPPVLFLHGGQDRMVPSSHATWLAGQVPCAEVWIRPDDGHVSILDAGPAALDWLRVQADREAQEA